MNMVRSGFRTNDEPTLVTVIMTSYNYARYLRQAVDSVLNQSYGNFELIVVDDGSTDESRTILSSLIDRRIRCEFQENGGQGAAWNRAFSMSRGQLVLFLDSDDWWEHSKIERMLAFHELLGADYGVLQHNLTVYRDGTTYPYRRTLPSGDCFSQTKVTGNFSYFVTSSGLGFSRHVLEKIFPLPETLRISPDAYLTRTAFLYGIVFSIPEPLGYLRLHGNNAGMTQEMEFHERLRREVIFPELNAYYAKHSIPYTYPVKKPSRRTELVQAIRTFVRSVAGLVR